MQLSRSKALVVAGVLVLAGIVGRAAKDQTGQTALPPVSPTAPTLGAVGSEHSHQSIVMIIEGQPVDFYQPKYIEKSDYAHFHADDTGGYFIHKHAKGVTLPFFLSTLGMKITNECLSLDTGEKYCSNETSKLSVYVNRRPYQDKLDFYELRDGDKILVDYGTSTPEELLLEANGIPDLPNDLAQHG